jgi:hypothetical protein
MNEELKTRRARQAAEGIEALAEYEAAAQAAIDRIGRLKAERLARAAIAEAQKTAKEKTG